MKPRDPERAVEALDRIREQLMAAAMRDHSFAIATFEASKICDAWVAGTPWPETLREAGERVAKAREKRCRADGLPKATGAPETGRKGERR